MLSRLLDQTITLVEAEAGSIWLYDPVNEIIELKMQQGWNDEYIGSVYKLGEGIPGLVIQRGKAYCGARVSSGGSACRKKLAARFRPALAALIFRYTRKTVLLVSCLSA